MAAADDQRKKDHRVHEGKGYMVLLAEIWLVAAISKYIQVPLLIFSGVAEDL